ncbi:MAG: ABC transporter permease [Ferruginibacter sp.]
MSNNYLIATFRNLVNNKVNTLINITGLAISIACCIFVYVFIKYEKGFDNFHSRGDRVYRIVLDEKKAERTEFNGCVSFPVANALRNDFPQLETVTQLYVNNNATISITDQNGRSKLFEDNQLTYADEYFLKTFDFKMLAGNDKLLYQPDEVILTRKLADNFFGTKSRQGYTDLIGKMITVNKNSYRITAILEDIPRNSNLACHMLLPFKVFEKINPKLMENWKDLYSESYTFVTLPKNYSAAQFDAALVGFKNKFPDKELSQRQTYHPQPLIEVHADEKYGGTFYTTPSILVLAFVIMGMIVLLTSCINFINLATVQSLKRAKEIGIRKTLGSRNYELVLRFMGETLIVTIIASAIAVLLADYFLNAFNNYLSFIVELDLHIDQTIIIFLAALCLVITFLAGYYPAKLMASYQSIQALKQAVKVKHTGFSNRFSFRKVLVITQFTVSQLLIIGTIVVAMQMRYFHNRELGYQKDGILTVELPENDLQKLAVFRNQLLSRAQVKEVSFSSGPPTSASNGFVDLRRREAGKAGSFNSERKFVDPHYLSVFNIKLIAGRNLQEPDKVTLSDSIKRYNILLNKKGAAAMGFKTADEAIGQEVVVGDRQFATIVGVTDDFFNVSLQQSIMPCMLFYGTNWVSMAAIRMDKANTSNTLSYIQKNWQSLFPGQIYKAMTLDYYMDKKAFYVLEDIMYQGFKIFVLLAILIGCLGLYGLVSFLAQQRQKEIGIRKVLGASVRGIVYLFSMEFTWLLLMSFVVAAPLGYFAMSSWLQTFANRIPLHAGYFVAALVISFLVAACTVGFQAVKAAVANPVKSLRAE